MRRISLSLAALALAAIAPAAHAQKAASPMSRVTVDLHANGSSVTPKDADTKSGGGAGVGLGYDVIPALRIVANVDLAKIDVTDEAAGIDGNFALRQIDLGARYSFMAQARRWTPFLQASVTPRHMGADVDDGSGNTVKVEMSGTAFSFGGGVDYAFSPRTSFGAGLHYTVGSFDKFKVDGQDAQGDKIDANGARLNVGVTWRPFSR